MLNLLRSRLQARARPAELTGVALSLGWDLWREQLLSCPHRLPCAASEVEPGSSQLLRGFGTSPLRVLGSQCQAAGQMNLFEKKPTPKGAASRNLLEGPPSARAL